MSTDADVTMWTTEAKDGTKITVTSLEAEAVKAYAEAMIEIMGLAPCPPEERAHVEFLAGFLGGVMATDNEKIAKIIAEGRGRQIGRGDRPMMAEIADHATPEERAKVKHEKFS